MGAVFRAVFCFFFFSVASGAFDPEGASNLVWPHMAASAVSLAKGEFLYPHLLLDWTYLTKGIFARISAVLDRVVVRTMETDDLFFFVHAAMLGLK
jgi:hypothetical protein